MSSTPFEDFKGTDRFAILRRLGAGGMGVVYEAYDRERQALVALKVIREASPDTVLLFKQEFRLLAETVHPNLVPLYELISDGRQWFFTMELLADAVDFLCYTRPVADGHVGQADPPVADADEEETIAADPREFNDSGPDAQARSGPGKRRPLEGVDLNRLRRASQQLVEGVQTLHGAGILHRDLKPENVLIRRDGRVVLLDFGLVTEMKRPREPGTPSYGDRVSSGDSTSRKLVGSIGYMSPEQAAAQPLTPASDWYAFGVMLYQALTGKRPFGGRPLEILRAKQRLDPAEPAEQFDGVPDDLNSLCADLLRRDPASRPDGSEILARLGAHIEARETPGEEQTAALFVGRKRQLEMLSDAFRQVLEGKTGIYRIHGRSGAGKTTLIEQFLHALAERGDTVILSGRCYEQESVPYKAVDSLVDDVARYLLQQSPAELEPLLPQDLAALSGIFPVLTRVSGIAEASEGRAGTRDLKEQRGRAFTALRELLVRIGERNRLVLYIDDLQWGDVDSAVLLRELFTPPDPPRLLMLFSYRTEYVEISTCLRALKDLGEDPDAGLFERQLELGALSEEETLELALGLLGQDEPDAEAHARWVVRESGGSALFVYELIQRVRAGLDRTESGSEGLHLDEILWQRIRRLPEQPRRILEAVAVAGRPVRLRRAQEAAGLHSVPPQVVAALRSEHLLRSTGPRLDDDVETYHDRIRESILAHLTADTLRAHHRGLVESLGREDGTPPEVLAAHLEGAGDPEQAGQHYEAAADQATRALAFIRAEDFYRRALALAGNDSGKARIHEKLIHYYTDLARFDDAYRTGLEGAKLYGVSLPDKFSPRSFIVDLVAARLRLGFRGVAQILDMPTMADERLMGAVRLIAGLAKAAYQIRPQLCVAVNAKMVNLCLKHGNTQDAAIGYMVFGAIFLGGVLGKYQRGYEFGRLALDLTEKYDNERQRAEVNFVVGYFGTSWLRPATEAEWLWKIAYTSGLGTGDLFHMGCACCATILSYFMRGVPTDRILEESAEFLALLRRVGLREPIGAITAVRQAIRNLRGETSHPTCFDDGAFDEPSYVEQLEGYGSRHFAHYYFIVKMQTLYLWGEYDAALEAASASARCLGQSTGMLHSAEHHFYHALTLAALGSEGGTFRRRSCRRTIRRTHLKLKKWALQCPANFRHKERLVAAELARLADEPERALGLLGQAAAAASEHGYLQVEALSHQLAARLHRDRDPAAADSHLDLAYDRYRRWGAHGIAERLESKTGIR